MSVRGHVVFDEVEEDSAAFSIAARQEYLRTIVRRMDDAAIRERNIRTGHVDNLGHPFEVDTDEEADAAIRDRIRLEERAPLTPAERARFRMVMEQEQQEMEEAAAAEPSQTVAAGSDRNNRTRELEMIASHANVVGLGLPPDLIALAYDRNNGELIDTLVNLTEPIFRRELERELAERQEEAEEEPPDARELDLWLLESQVPGCTRERAERAYEQSNEDVSRALPLARMGTLLADRDAMIVFLREQHHEATPEDAEVSYEFMEGDVVEAAAHMVRGIRWRANESPLSARRMHTVRLRTVFHLALLYRERYRMEPDEETLPAGVAVRAFTATAEEAVQHGLVRVRPTPTAEADNVPPPVRPIPRAFEEEPDRQAFEEEPSVEQRAAALDFTAARFAMLRPSSAAAPAAAPDAVTELNETLAAGDEERPPRNAMRERLLATLQRANGPPERPADFTGSTGTPWRYTRARGWTRVSEEERADVVMAAATERERRFQQSLVSASWGAPPVAELRQQFEARVADAEGHRGARAWHDAQGARDLELQQLRRRLAETEGWPEGQVFIRNRLRTLLTETLVAHAEREHNLDRQFPLSPPWIVVLQTVRRWDGRGTSERDVREVLDDAARLRRQALGAAAVVPAAPANGGRSFYREIEDDPIEPASETESDASPIPVRLASGSSSDGEDENQAATFRAPDALRRREIVMASRSGYRSGHVATRLGRAIHPAPLPSPPFHERIKQSLRVVQERVDAEMVGASQGEVFSEGAYLDIMNAIKQIWEAVDMAFVV